jgi:tRNA threonylcarbamoyladenosine biosynthesis protein TsaE
MRSVSKSLSQTGEIALAFLDELSPQKNKAVIVALFGDLGAGKTAFVKKCAEHFGIAETIISPTFIIEKIYKIPRGKDEKWKHLIHIDAYRFENEDEIKHIGFREISHDPQNIIFIEWPERIKNYLPNDVHEIFFEFVDENTRKIEVRR